MQSLSDEPAGLPPEPPELPELRRGPTRWQLSAQASGSTYSLSHRDIPSGDGNRGSGSVSGTRFMTPVLDDDAPRSLQPYLQGVSAISASVRGGGSVSRFPGSPSKGTSGSVGAGAGLDMYINSYFALLAGASYSHGFVKGLGAGRSWNSVAGSAGVGLRLHNTRLDATYTFRASATDGRFDDLRWGSVDVRLQTVIARCFLIAPWGSVSDGANAGGLDLGYYVTKDLGLFVSGFGGSIVYTADDVHGVRYGGSLGLSSWVSPSVRLGLDYNLNVLDVPLQYNKSLGYAETEHAVSFTGVLRLP